MLQSTRPVENCLLRLAVVYLLDTKFLPLHALMSIDKAKLKNVNDGKLKERFVIKKIRLIFALVAWQLNTRIVALRLWLCHLLMGYIASRNL